MTPENTPALEPQPAGMGEFSRLSGVFFEPRAAFADIAERPRFWVPLILMIVASLAYTITISQRIGWDRVVQHQLESRMAQMSEQQREAVSRTMDIQVKMASIFGYVGGAIGVPIYYLIVGGILLGIVRGIMSVPVRFKQAFTIMCYASLPGLIFTVLAIAVMFLKNPDDFDMRNPLPFFNLGGFMDPQSPLKFLHSVASSLDVFAIWTILLVAAGLKSAGGKKLSFGGSLMAVAVPWAIWVLLRASLASRFS
ncbi:MAG: YIP1 family protein [Bryobacteraceae bacterium]